MKNILKLAYQLYQTLFYIFILVSAVSVIFWLFGQTTLKTVGYLLLFTFGFLFLHILFYRIYTAFYMPKKPPVPTHLEE